MTFRAVIVAAVSTKAQAREEAASIPAQLELCRETCARAGWLAVGEIVIPGHSRDYLYLSDLERDSPEFAALMAHVRNETANLLVCWRFDRLWRTGFLSADIQRECAIHSAQIYSCNQPKMPVPPESLRRRSGYDRLLETFSGLASEAEQEQRVQRHRMGMEGRTKRGVGSQSIPPYGYDRVSDGVFTINESEASWVRWMFEQSAQGWGVNRMAKHLDAQGVPTPSMSRPGVPIKARIWNVTSIHVMLRNPWYAGGVRWGSASSPNGNHPPLVDLALWERVQTLLPQRLIHRVHDPVAPRWLGGLARCGFCGHTMAMYRAQYDVPSMRCSLYANSGRRECQSNYHKAVPVHDYVRSALADALAHPDAWRIAREAQSDTAAIRARLAVIERAVVANRATHERAYDAYIAGAASLNELTATRSRLDSEHAGLLSESATLRARSTPPPDLPPIADAYALDDDALRALAYLLVSRVIVQRGAEPVIVWL